MYLIIDSSINLLEDVSKNSDRLRITYDDMPVNEHFFLLKAFIYYDGKDDLTKRIIVKYPSVLLAKDTVIHNCLIVDNIYNIVVTPNINQHSIVFDMDLMKSKEFFSFETLIEAKDITNSNTYELISRIENVKNYKTLDLKSLGSAPAIGNLFLTIIAAAFSIIVSFIATDSTNIIGNSHYKKTLLYKGSVVVFGDELEGKQDMADSSVSTMLNRYAVKTNSKNLLNDFKNQSDFIIKGFYANIEADSIISVASDNLSVLQLSNLIDTMNGKVYSYKLKNNFSVEFTYSELWEIRIMLLLAFVIGLSLIYVLYEIKKTSQIRDAINTVSKFKGSKVTKNKS
ncbi:hypothetical protein [Fibrella forsythiae]|uniref:Uncharacterized protein n=1 Tax=Fibrella forsythiae TaxID=2817061 RepID=A0ABS3JLK5_9BACT|nr:hypothetical protein [Fibrella forsythiae]MBO0950891.1 hypothetical protein [Fibrella forsythiae]